MSTPANPQDPSGAPTEKLPAEESAGTEAVAASGGGRLSEQTQKALIAVTAGAALVLSIIALVVAIAGGDGHHGKGPHGGHMGGGPRMEHRGGGGPMMGVPQGGYYDQAPGQPGDEQQEDTNTTPERN